MHIDDCQRWFNISALISTPISPAIDGMTGWDLHCEILGGYFVQRYHEVRWGPLGKEIRGRVFGAVQQSQKAPRPKPVELVTSTSELVSLASSLSASYLGIDSLSRLLGRGCTGTKD